MSEDLTISGESTGDVNGALGKAQELVDRHGLDEVESVYVTKDGRLAGFARPGATVWRVTIKGRTSGKSP